MEAIKNPSDQENKDLMARFTAVDRLYLIMRTISGQHDDGDLSHLYQFWAKTAINVELQPVKERLMCFQDSQKVK